MNEYLKDLCELCGFNTPVKYSYYVGGVRHDEVYPKWEMLGTHGGRRTFICAAFEMGISLAIVMKITRHKDYEAMKPYIAIMDKSKKAAMNAILQPGDSGIICTLKTSENLHIR